MTDYADCRPKQDSHVTGAPCAMPRLIVSSYLALGLEFFARASAKRGSLAPDQNQGGDVCEIGTG